MPDEHLSDEEWAQQLAAEQAAAEAAALAKAKADAQSSGKEAFDLDRFEQIYDTTTDMGSLPAREVRVKEYEHKYYLRFRDLMTMQALAEKLEELDVWRS